MTKIEIKVPKSLIDEKSIEFAKYLRNLELADEYTFDFKNLKYTDPFSLIYISSEIQTCRSIHKNSKFNAINYQDCTYPAHMGFFKAFGMDYGKNPGEALGSSTYVPINIYDTKQIKNKAKELMVNPAELLESLSMGLANVLTNQNEGKLKEVLTYCLREIFRNVIEHSRAEQLGYCAQYRKSKNRVSFSIIDRGIGLRASLLQNPKLKLNNDKEAILESLKPAVSSKVYSGQKRKPKGDWVNSGYGLFMTSNICLKGGSFFIASGNVGYYMSEKKTQFLETPFEGTALNLAIDTTKIDDLNTMLSEFRNNENNLNSSLSSPSKSSLGLIKKK